MLKRTIIILALLGTLTTQATSYTIVFTAPTTVAKTVDNYRAECAADGGEEGTPVGCEEGVPEGVEDGCPEGSEVGSHLADVLTAPS